MTEMIWPDALQALLDRLNADTELLNLLGGEPHIYQSTDARAGRVPSIGFTVIWDREEEVTAPFEVQWDVFAPHASAVALERRLRKLVKADTPRVIGGVWMWMLFQDARGHGHPDAGVRHRSFDVRYEPIRPRG